MAGFKTKLNKNNNNKQDLSISCLQETHFRTKDMHRQKMRRWKKISHANEN